MKGRKHGNRTVVWFVLALLFVMLVELSVYVSAPSIGELEMVKDINLAGDSYPFYFTVVGVTPFFTAHDGTNGRELWKLETSKRAPPVGGVSVSVSKFELMAPYIVGLAVLVSVLAVAMVVATHRKKQ